jgi:hypothetical protein
MAATIAGLLLGGLITGGTIPSGRHLHIIQAELKLDQGDERRDGSLVGELHL